MTADLECATHSVADASLVDVVCPTLIARTCGLPIAAMAVLDTPGLLRSHAALRADTDRLALLGPRLAERLTAVVPLLPPVSRRALLAARRNAYQGRPVARLGLNLGLNIAELAAAGHRGTADDLQRYLDVSIRVEASADAVGLAAGGELGIDPDRLAAVLHDPAVRRSLALASPDFARTLDRPLPSCGSNRRRWIRSAIGYLVRCVLKPSPFGSLTTVAAVPITERFDGARPADGPAVGEPTGPVVTGTLPLAIELLLAAVLRASRFGRGEAAGDVPLVANASIRPGRDLPSMLAPIRLCSEGFFFRDEHRLRPSGVPDALLTATDRAPVAESASQQQWRHRLGVSGPALGRLVGAGVLQPVLPFDPAEQRPLAALAGAVPELPGIAELAEQESSLADVDPGRRAAAVRALRSTTAASLTAMGRRAPAWLSTAPLAQDVVATVGSPTSPPAGMAADLTGLAGALAANTVRTAFYDQLVGRFVAEYGSGGVCSDLLDFTYRVVSGERWIRELRSAREADRTAAVLGSPAGDGTLAPATASVLAQRAVDIAGRSLTVINRMNPGPGALLARWAVRPEIEAALTAHTAWLKALHPGCLVLSVSAGEDWAPVQRQPTGGLGRLRWPTSLRTDPGDADLDLGRLGLRHDPVGGTLQAFERRSGMDVAFAYLGVIPRHLITGPLRVVMTLSDPWVIRTRVGGDVPRDDNPPDDNPPDDDGHDDGPARPRSNRARRSDRRLLAGVVVERETWSLPVAELPAIGDLGNPVALLDSLNAWWQLHDLPPRVFCTGESMAGARVGKPAWMSLDHPISVWAAVRSLDPRAVRVSITEALPDLLGAGTTERAVEWAAALRLDGGS